MQNRNILIFVIFVFTLLKSHATDFKIENNKLLLNGLITGDQVQKFEKILDQNKAVEFVVLENSLGGTVDGFFGFSNAIKKRNLNTIIRGKCFSTCAYVFLAGKRRFFEKGGYGNRSLSFHVSRPKDSLSVNDHPVNDEILKFFNDSTNGKVSIYIQSLIRSSKTENSGVIFVQRNLYFFDFYEAFYCDGSRKSIDEHCQRIDNINLKEMNIITE